MSTPRHIHIKLQLLLDLSCNVEEHLHTLLLKQWWYIMERTINPYDAHIGAQLRLIRMQRGVSQQFLGETVNITFQQIQKYEKGVNRIGAGRLYEFAKALDVPVAAFFEGIENVEPHSHAPLPMPNVDGGLLGIVSAWPDLNKSVRGAVCALVEAIRKVEGAEG